MKQKMYVVDDVIVHETIYRTTGMVEITYSLPELIDGAGNITQAVVSRYNPKGPWTVSTREANRAHVGRIKRHAITFALMYAKRERARMADLYERRKA